MDTVNSFNNKKYIEVRDKLVEKNEAFINNIYLDTYGLPTAGIGVLLVERQKDRSWELNYSRVNLLADITNLSNDNREKLISTLEKYTNVLDKHKDEKFQNLAAFKNSKFGQEAQSVLGDISFNKKTSSWDILTSSHSAIQFTMTREQTLKLYNGISSEYENRLNRLLKEKNCPIEALSEEQRASLYSMVYHGSRGKAGKLADAVGDYWRGEISEENLRARIKRDGMDTQFPERSKNEIDYMNHIKERPRQRNIQVSENFTSPETGINNGQPMSKYDEVRAMLDGLLNDTDGSYARKVLAENPEKAARFDEKVRQSIEQDKQQEMANRESQTIQHEEQQRGFSRSFG